MNEFEAIFDGELEAEVTVTRYRGSLVFNVPVVEDKMALRVAAYSDTEGGYITMCSLYCGYECIRWH